jgi:hypothetical protein
VENVNGSNVKVFFPDRFMAVLRPSLYKTVKNGQDQGFELYEQNSFRAMKKFSSYS